MDESVNNWEAGTIVTLPRRSKEVAKDRTHTFDHLVDSKYICIRPAIDGQQRGILVKVLGKYSDEDFLIKNGEPFCKEEKIVGFNNYKYYGYRIPATHELREVLDIIRQDHTLQTVFSEAAMPIHLDSTFWVRDTARRYLFWKKLQCYDASTDECMIADSGDDHWHLTIVYFYQSKIKW